MSVKLGGIDPSDVEKAEQDRYELISYSFIPCMFVL